MRTVNYGDVLICENRDRDFLCESRGRAQVFRLVELHTHTHTTITTTTTAAASLLITKFGICVVICIIT